MESEAIVTPRCGRRAALGSAGAVAWMVLIVAIAHVGHAPRLAAAQQAASPVELRVAWWGSQDRHNRTIKAIELFQKKHPHVKVSYEFAGWSDYWTKMTTQAAGPNLPDVMQQDYAYIAEWSSRGLLAPLDDHVKNGTIDTRNVSEALLKGGVVGGKLVAINLGSNSQCWVIDLVRTHHRAGYAFIGLWLIGFFGLTLLPMAASLYFVFTDYDILTPPRWIGVANFRRMFFEDARYLQSVTVTTFYVAIAVPVRLAFALAIAMLVNTGRRGVSVYRAAYYAPSVVARSLRHSVRPTLSALFG